ncbi:MAG: translation initiation factor IF-2 [Firmicutes bacterium]|nr:translation initiation factor IF-2 [Bacillota bacterium]
MSIRVHELAKELNLSNEEIMERLDKMGSPVTSHSSNVSDIDAAAIRNIVIHSRQKSETKIVKVAPKQSDAEGQKDVKVSVKPVSEAAFRPQGRTAPKRQEAAPAQTRSAAGKTAAAKTAAAGVKGPQGTPLPKSASMQAPMGTPLPKSASMQAPQGTPLPKSASMQAPMGTPLPKSASVQAPQGTPLPKSESLQEEVKPAPAEQPQATPLPKAPEKEAPAAVKEEKAPVAEKEAPKAAPVEEQKRPSGIKILKTAAQVQEEERQAAERAAAAAAARKAERTERPQGDRPARDGYRSSGPRDRDGQGRPGGYRDGGQRPAGGQGRPGGNSFNKDGERRPPRDQQNRGPRFADKDADEAPRPSAPRQRPRPAAESGGEGMAKPTRKDGGNNRKDPRKERTKSIFESQKSIEKTAPKKHKKEKKVEVEESRINLEELPTGTKIVNVPITVKGLGEQIEVSTSMIIMSLMKLGIMANINQNLDEDTVVLLGAELGMNIVVDKVEEEVVEEGLELFEDREEDLKARPPIITVMGHVDHGKTSLLDSIRKTNVTVGEAGGITQHIGASEVTINGQRIVFLDTPGHEAFTAMRARGAHATDIAVLVVAADDSVKPQTVESISHAKAAGVPIIVAINKMDKPAANPDRVKQDLTEHGILVEEWGGETICVPVSAKTGEGIVNLLEMILLQAEMLELKANPNRLALGTVIEARLDKSRGPVATLLVLNGTLHAGQSIVAGTCAGRIRAMTNHKGEVIKKAGPATAVEITGLTEVPEAGDEFNAVKEDKIAREIAEHRKQKVREEVMLRTSSTTLEQLFSQIQAGEVKDLNLIIKADVQGSVGALIQSLEKLSNENVKIRIIHSGVGTVTESDVMLAGTANAIIIGFNVRPSSAVTAMADRDNIEIRTYRVIYEALDDIEAAMKGMLDPEYKEVILGKVEIRNTFKVPGVGIIGGAYVLEGKVQRNASVRLVRDGIVIHEGKISSLKRFKDDAKEVNTGYECGIGIENYNDIKEGDIIEAFVMEEIERK